MTLCTLCKKCGWPVSLHLDHICPKPHLPLPPDDTARPKQKATTQ